MQPFAVSNQIRTDAVLFDARLDLTICLAQDLPSPRVLSGARCIYSAHERTRTSTP